MTEPLPVSFVVDVTCRDESHTGRVCKIITFWRYPDFRDGRQRWIDMDTTAGAAAEPWGREVSQLRPAPQSSHEVTGRYVLRCRLCGANVTRSTSGASGDRLATALTRIQRAMNAVGIADRGEVTLTVLAATLAELDRG